MTGVAHAGTWQARTNDPAYSCTTSVSGGATIYLPPGTGANETPNSANGHGPAGASFTVSGTASFQWTWVSTTTPKEPAPAQVILQEKLNPSDKLSVGTVTVTPSATTEYEVKDSTSGTVTLSLPVTATATFSGNGGGTTLIAGASISLGCVTVTPTGVNTANQALTGQQVTGTLVTTNPLPAGTKFTSYTWSFTGNTAPSPIKTWDGTNNAQQLFPLLPADLTQTDTTGNGLSVPPISFYDLTGDNKFVIKCAVSLKFPDGTTQTVTAQSPTISFMKPTASWTVNSAPPYLPRPLPATENPGFYSDNATYMQATEWWDPITITDPTGFTGGKGSVAQITTPSRTSTRIPTGTGHATYTVKIQSPPGSGTWISPGTGLDGSFPYANGWADDGYGHEGSVIYDPVNGYTWDVSSTGHSQDVPNLQFYPPDAGDNGGTNWTYAKDADSFSTWLMYRPPANGSFGTIWVPLQHLTWNWGGTANKSGATWAITSPVFSPGSPAVYPTPPAWDHTIVNDTQHY